MKRITVAARILLCILMLGLCAFGQSQPSIEARVRQIMLYQPGEGEGYYRKSELERLGNTNAVREVLLTVVAKYGHAQPGTVEYAYLYGVIRVLGEMQEAKAAPLLKRMLANRNTDKIIRAESARALGQIDPDGNKDLLLSVLRERSDFQLIRTEAAGALAKTKDPKVLQVLEQSSREEKDAYVRQQLDKSAQELRRRIQHPQ